MASGRGMRKIVVDGEEWFWKVREGRGTESHDMLILYREKPHFYKALPAHLPSWTTGWAPEDVADVIRKERE